MLTEKLRKNFQIMVKITTILSFILLRYDTVLFMKENTNSGLNYKLVSRLLIDGKKSGAIIPFQKHSHSKYKLE